MALARAEAVAVPLNTRLAAPELRFALDDCGAAAIVADADNLALAARARRRPRPIVLPVRGEGDSIAQPARDRARPAARRRRRRRARAPRRSSTPRAPPASRRASSAATAPTPGTPSTRRSAPRATPADVELFNLPIFGIGFLHFPMPGAARRRDRGPRRRLRARPRLGPAGGAPRDPHLPRADDDRARCSPSPGHEARDLSALEVVYTAYAFPERLRRAALERFGEVFVYMYGLTEAQLTCARRGDFAAEPTSVGRSMGVSAGRASLDPDGRRGRRPARSARSPSPAPR